MTSFGRGLKPRWETGGQFASSGSAPAGGVLWGVRLGACEIIGSTRSSLPRLVKCVHEGWGGDGKLDLGQDKFPRGRDSRSRCLGHFCPISRRFGKGRLSTTMN